jgi:UDP-N-acetylglucosamine 2-epimerase (non-hydrolysing)
MLSWRCRSLACNTVDPQGHLELNQLVKHTKDGITGKAVLMGVPCLILPNSTERPEPISVGTNELIGTDPAKLR